MRTYSARQSTRHGNPKFSGPEHIKSFFYDKLIRTIASEIGSQINSYLPLTGAAAKLYNEARRAGLAKEDLITKSLELISAISLPARNINGTNLAKDLAGTNSHESLVRAINSNLLSGTSKVFMFLIDDTDQLAKPSEPEQLNKIWALILAVRRLTMECPNIRPILTLRSSVWSRLINENSGQRDQVDHIRPLVFSLLANDQLIIDIIEKRLARAARDTEQISGKIYEPFFEEFNMTLPTSDERRSWPIFISKSSRERPRDALQLIKLMIESAVHSHRQKINDSDASDAMLKYSDERVTDIVVEYSLDCPAIREIIDSFHAIDFEVDFEDLRRHLNGVSGITSIKIRGQQINTQLDEDSIKLLSLLHEVGFINPRVQDTSKTRKFRHISYSEDSIFVRHTNWNNLQAAHWEIHPAFRDHLIKLKKAKDLRRIV